MALALDPSILAWLQKQGQGAMDPPQGPSPDAQPPVQAQSPAQAGNDATGDYMASIKKYLSDFGPGALQNVQGQQRMDDITGRLGYRLDNAAAQIISGPPPAAPLPQYDRVRDWAMRKQVGQENLGTQMQIMQMDPNGPLARAKISGLQAAGVKLPDGSSPLVADAYLGGIKSAGEAQKPAAESAAALAGADKARAETAAIPQELQIKLAGLQKDYDLKDKEIAAAARQGDLNRATELAKAQMSIDAEMTRLRANISAENTGDADWQIGDQFSGGVKKLPEAAREVLKKSPGARALLDNSARAESLIRKHPDGVLRGDDAANLDRWLKEMTAQLNGIWGMGILKQSNMGTLEEALQNPTQLGSILKSKAKGVDFLNQLHQFQTMVKQRMLSEATATGALSPKQGGYYEGFQNVSGKDAGNLTGEDAAAAAWAKANPNDPRSKAILAHLNGG